VLNNGEKRIYGIVCSVSGFVPHWLYVSVLKSSMCDVEKTFEEFREGVIEIYASVGCWACFVLDVSFEYGL